MERAERSWKTELTWKIGFEIELLAPPGRSRRDLAQALAGSGGEVRAFWHMQSEPSEVPGLPVFHNLTQGFEAIDAAGRPVARVVDDLTLQDDLDRRAPPREGWWRVVSDDARLLRLVARQASPTLPPEEALAPLVPLFGGALQCGAGEMVKLVDESGASVALAAPLPGERERGAELISPPIAEDHAERLGALLGAARALGFRVPVEAAVHLHFDATPLCDPGRLRGLARLWEEHGEVLKTLVSTNPRCRRLGPWAPALREVLEAPDWLALDGEQARARLAATNPSKYCDLNLRNLALGTPDKHTVEVRVLPGARDPEPVLLAAALFEGLLRAASAEVPAAPALPWSRPAAERLLARLPLDSRVRRAWLARAAEIDLRR